MADSPKKRKNLSRRTWFGGIAAVLGAAVLADNTNSQQPRRPGRRARYRVLNRHIEFTCKVCHRDWAITVPDCPRPLPDIDICPGCFDSDVPVRFSEIQGVR